MNFGENIFQFITYQHSSEDVRNVGSFFGAMSLGLLGTSFGLKMYNRYYRVYGYNHNYKYSERFQQAFKNFLAILSGYGGITALTTFLGIIIGRYPVILIPTILLGIPAIDAI